MAAMFFEKRKFPHSVLFPLDRYLYTKFQVDRTNGFYSLQFSNLIAPPSGKAAQFFIWPKNYVINKFPEFGEDISFHSRV